MINEEKKCFYEAFGPKSLFGHNHLLRINTPFHALHTQSDVCLYLVSQVSIMPKEGRKSRQYSADSDAIWRTWSGGGWWWGIQNLSAGRGASIKSRIWAVYSSFGIDYWVSSGTSCLSWAYSSTTRRESVKTPRPDFQQQKRSGTMIVFRGASVVQRNIGSLM